MVILLVSGEGDTENPALFAGPHPEGYAANNNQGVLAVAVAEGVEQSAEEASGAVFGR